MASGSALTGRIALGADVYLSFVLCLLYILKYLSIYSVGCLPYIFSGSNLIFHHFYFSLYTMYTQKYVHKDKHCNNTVKVNTISV